MLPLMVVFTCGVLQPAVALAHVSDVRAVLAAGAVVAVATADGAASPPALVATTRYVYAVTAERPVSA